MTYCLCDTCTEKYDCDDSPHTKRSQYYGIDREMPVCGDYNDENMHQFTVDLCSFTVYAKDEDDARAKAIKMLETGEERATIDQIIKDDPY